MGCSLVNIVKLQLFICARYPDSRFWGAYFINITLIMHETLSFVHFSLAKKRAHDLMAIK